MSYVGLCANGHITGFKKCGTCGAKRGPGSVGIGRVLTPRHLIDRDKSELWKLRCATRSSGGPQGPNKVANFPSPSESTPGVCV